MRARFSCVRMYKHVHAETQTGTLIHWMVNELETLHETNLPVLKKWKLRLARSLGA